MATEAFPAVPKALLDRLEEVFPDRLPADLPSDAEVALRIGQQQVIRKLRHEYNRQQNNILNS